MKTNKKIKKNVEIKKIRKEWKNILFDFIFTVLTLLFVILFKERIIIATLLIIIIAILGLNKWKSRVTSIIFIFGALFGAILEMIAINYGVWNYSFVNFINIPLWLFVVWGNASACIYQISLEIKRLGVKEK